MLTGHQVLRVRQEVEPLQVFTGLETNNRYRIMDERGETVAFAAEDSGFMTRQFLRGHRPLSIRVVDETGAIQMLARRDFFWLFSHLRLTDGGGQPLADMQRRFRVLDRRFDVITPDGDASLVHGPLLRPYTFWLKRGGVDVAKITKRWSGVAKEVFTVADSFSLEFLDDELPDRWRWIALGAAFAIDLDFFERRGKRGMPNFAGGWRTGGISGRGV